jgi:ribosomal protein L7/L12
MTESKYSIKPVGPMWRQFAQLVNQYVGDLNDMLLLTNSVTDLANECIEDAVDDCLDEAGHPFRNIIREQDEENQRLHVALAQQTDARNDLHQVLVNVARQDAQILTAMEGAPQFRKKIEAIKRLRAMTLCSLKAAKEAIEDPRVSDAANPMFEVVGVGFFDPNIDR